LYFPASTHLSGTVQNYLDFTLCVFFSLWHFKT
jgi:hypothetical protein